MTQPSVLVLGATSDMAQAFARKMANDGFDLVLAGRNTDELDAIRRDLLVRSPSCSVQCLFFDAMDMESHSEMIDRLSPLPEVAACFVGSMGDEIVARYDAGALALILRSNFEGPANVLGLVAKRFEGRGSGTIVGVSSVAGERGRKTNYVYGSAKAGFTAFLSGLRNQLQSAGVHVVTVLPGFVATKMTSHLSLPPALTAKPEAVASAIAKAIRKETNVIYVKPVWFVIMTIIKAIPESIFKKMSL